MHGLTIFIFLFFRGGGGGDGGGWGGGGGLFSLLRRKNAYISLTLICHENKILTNDTFVV